MALVKPRPALTKIRKGETEAGYLLLGNEHYFRDELRRAIVKAVFGGQPAHDDDALVEVDLADQPLDALLDEAKTLSLFASDRLILGRNAEAVLPSGRAGGKAASAGEPLQRYFANPTPGVVVVIEAPKWDWTDRDDKPKLERAAKFFAAVPTIVELRRMAPGEVAKAAASVARGLKLDISAEMLAELADMLACDMTRMSKDLEKLALFVGPERAVTREDLEALVPEARQSQAFAFSDALARRDQAGALDVIDRMARTGEYWPLQINMVAGLFRQTLAAKEKRAKSAQQVRQALGGLGITVWPSRAEQIAGIGQRFNRAELERALAELFRADRDLRFPTPDERLIVERLVFAITR